MSAEDRARLHDLQQETELPWYYKIFNGSVMIDSFGADKSRIENLEVMDDDIWVTSFPKSGTTWVQEMVWLLTNDLDYKGANTILDQRYSYIESGSFAKAYANGSMPALPFPDPINMLERKSGKRYVKSHLQWDLLPSQIRDGSKKAKVIHIIRNPKDVCVSYFHHTKIFPMLYVSMEEYFKQFISDKFMYGPYWKTILSYWNKRDLENVLILRYEDMIEDLPAAIRKTAKFLDKSPSDEEIAKLAEHLSFEQMKKNKAVNFEQITGLLQMLGILKEKYTFMRKGKIGSHKEELDEEMIRLLDTWCELNNTDTGLEFNY